MTRTGKVKLFFNKDNSSLELPTRLRDCIHNTHMFYLKVTYLKTRTKLLQYVKKNDSLSVFHCIRVHTSLTGIHFGRMDRKAELITAESVLLIKLPFFFGFKIPESNKIIKVLNDYCS